MTVNEPMMDGSDDEFGELESDDEESVYAAKSNPFG